MWDPPASTEVEITFLGPGFGEACLIHFGNGCWGLIDSCWETNTHPSIPAPFAYFSSLGLNLPDHLRFIVATHWHDDHVGGLSQIVEQCPETQLCVSAAVGKEEFIKRVKLFNRSTPCVGGSGVKEFDKIFNIFEEDSNTRPYPAKAVPNRLLDSLTPSQSGHGLPVKVWTLSPSDPQIDRFLLEITQLLPEEEKIRRRPPSPNTNFQSVVTWIEIGDLAILLGGDLEKSSDSKYGWASVIDTARTFVNRALVFKIPHHGAFSGYDPNVWRDLLTEDPISVLTPFVNGGVRLPSDKDVQRILSHSNFCYSTSYLNRKRTKKRSASVEKTIRETVGRMQASEPETGIVRLRKDLASDSGGEWNVELINNACPLAQINH